MALFNNSAESAGSNSTSASTSTSTDNSAEGSAASIEGESALEPDIPRFYVISHDNDTVTDLKSAEFAKDQGDASSDDEERETEGDSQRSHYRIGRSLASSTTTLTSLGGARNSGVSSSIATNADSLCIPRERSYGNDNADGDDDGNEEDIEDGDEYDEADDLYDQLFDLQDPISRKAALATASALFAKQVGSSSTGKDDIEMEEIERSFLRCTKPICSKKELISCLSSRSTSPGPISPLLSDEDFPSLCSATSGSCSTAPSSRRSSDGSHTPKVRFKKGCVITAVNLTWAPTTYDRAPIDVAESLDMHRCQNVEDAEGYAQDDASALAIHDQVAAVLENSITSRGEWQAFAPGIYNPDDLSIEVVPRAPPSPPAPSSPATSAQVKYAYAASFGSTIRRIASPEESPSSSDYQSGFSFSRSTVGYPLSRQSCFESTSSSSSSSESECDDIIERCRGLHDLHQNPVQVQALKTSPRQNQPTIYRPTARSPIRHSLVSSTATVETSLGAAARELSDSLDESSRSSSPSLSRHTSDNEDCLSSTPRAGTGNFMSRRTEYLSVSSSTSQSSSAVVHGFALCPTRQADFEANGTHDTSPPPQEEQPARKVQRLLERRNSSTCSLSRFPTSGDIWESCEALGGF